MEVKPESEADTDFLWVSELIIPCGIRIYAQHLSAAITVVVSRDQKG